MNNNTPSANPASFVLLLVFSCLIGFLLGGLASSVVLGPDAQKLLGLSADEMGITGRQRLRLAQSLGHILSIAVPSLVVAYLAYRENWARELGLKAKVEWSKLGWSVILLLASFPLVAYLHYLNLQIDLPGWATNQEASTNNLMQAILTYEHSSETILLFITIAIVPALGEELLTRGLIQGKILPLFLKNKHAHIWIAAFIFSAMHMELGGLLPRWALGAVFGYAYLWTKSLWVPILMHLLFNGIQALLVIYSGEFTPDTEVTEVPSLILAAAGLLVCSWVIYNLDRKSDT